MSIERSTATGLTLRPYQDADEEEILSLLHLSLGGGPAGQRPPEYFRWKHLDNPFGRSFMLVAEDAGQLVGFRALMRWRFQAGGRTFEAVRPVDTVTHPEHRGRGVFSKLTMAALEALDGKVDLVFNTPNPDSLAGYLKMGWHVVGGLRPSIRPCAAALHVSARFSSRSDEVERPIITAPAAADVLTAGVDLDRLIRDAEPAGAGLATPITGKYLRWRYGDAPLLGYHAIREERGDELIGLAVFRPRREGTREGLVVSQLLVRAGDVRTARKLLGQVRRSARVEFVATLFPRTSTARRATRGPLTLRAPRSITFVVNPLRSAITPDPLLLSSWSLSTGDVEVF